MPVVPCRDCGHLVTPSAPGCPRCKCTYPALSAAEAKSAAESKPGVAGPALGDIDIDTLTEATRRYTELRRLYRQLFCVGMPLFAMFLTFRIAFGPRTGSPGKDIFDLLVYLGFSAYVGGISLMWHWLMLFACPRCGERLAVSPDGWSSLAVCKHCGQRME